MKGPSKKSWEKVWVPRDHRYVFKFDIHKPRWGRIRDTIPDTGQCDSELEAHAALLLVELQRRHKENRPTANKILFGQYIRSYQDESGEHSQTTIVEDLFKALGNIDVTNGNFTLVEQKFLEFMRDQKGRRVQRWKRDPDTWELKLCDTNRIISDATLQAYRRYFCCICGHGRNLKLSDSLPRILEKNDPSSSVVVGKPKKRRRAIMPNEFSKLYKAMKEHSEVAWLEPWIDFAKTMPIRPEDMCSLRVGQIDILHWQIIYTPGKTEETSGLEACAAILPFMQDYMCSRVERGPDAPIFHRNEEPINYNQLDGVWQVLKKYAQVRDFRFYDLRHEAISFLFNLGFRKQNIKEFAGWSSDAMFDTYNTRDRRRLAQVVRETLKNGNQEMMDEMRDAV